MNKNIQYTILAIDTATRCCTVSLTRGGLTDGEVLGLQVLNNDLTHSRRLLMTIEDVMSKTGISWQQVDGIAVGLGPGSFTGLRIGMATAKGLVASAGIPLLGVSSLDVLAASCFPVADCKVCSIIDARKKEVYAALYTQDGSGLPVRDGEILAISPEELAGRIESKVLLVGDGVLTYRQKLQELLGDKALFAPSHLLIPNGAALGLLAHDQLLNQPASLSQSVAPLYVRASDAELSLGKRIMD